MMRRLLIGAALLLALGSAGVLAQDEPCPESFTCVPYAETIIEIDPDDGPVQAFIVEEREITIVDFDGERTRHQVKVAVFASNGDGFALEHEYVVERSNRFAEADLGDAYALSEVN